MRRLATSRVGQALWPRSLRRQFTAALSALALLVTAGNLIAVFALHVSARTTASLEETSVTTLQDAQLLVSTTLLIEREARQLLSAGAIEEVRTSHAEINALLQELDTLVQDLAVASGDISVLTLHQSGQLFRNTTHTLAGLRESAISADAAFSAALARHTGAPETSVPNLLVLHRLRDTDDPGEIEAMRRAFLRGADASRLASDDPFALRARLLERQRMLDRFYVSLDGQSVALVAAAQEVAAEVTEAHRRRVDELARGAIASERLVVAFLLGSLVVAWLVSRYLLGRRVLARLLQVSRYLRRDAAAGETPRIPVRGDDEIGEMARAVEQFMEDRRQLAAAHRELEAFSYSVAHDLRAPLRAIDGFAEILRLHEAELGEEARRSLEVIRRNARRMSELIDDILKLSRVTRGELNLAPIDLAALAREVFAEARADAPGRDIELRLGHLPEVVADEALLRQVLVNLVCNAVKFTAPKPKAVIEMDGRVEGELCVYRVADNGVGFDMAKADKLFGTFERLHSSREFEGTGVGLAIVKRVVERHGGRVWAEARVGEGATFHFALPCREPPRTAGNSAGQR